MEIPFGEVAGCVALPPARDGRHLEAPKTDDCYVSEFANALSLRDRAHEAEAQIRQGLGLHRHRRTERSSGSDSSISLEDLRPGAIFPRPIEDARGSILWN